MEIISKYLNFLSITLYYNLEYHLSLFYTNEEICHKIQKAIDEHLRFNIRYDSISHLLKSRTGLKMNCFREDFT